ncbi:MAG: type IV secretion system DNA-binding domain-containing protein [Cyanobacteria bacterium P01_H01_bin.121]
MAYFPTTQQQPVATTQATSVAPLLKPLQTDLLSGNGMILLVCLAALAGLAFLGPGNRKAELASGRWVKGNDKRFARKRAHNQINQRKKNAVSLYLNWPAVKATATESGRRYHFTKEAQTTYVPDAQRGIAVAGAPGTGKTFSVIDPLIRSTIHQGFPLILYDFKYPTQSSRIASLAARMGYQVHIFAPGFPESEVCNPLDFMKDEEDALMARQMATVLNRNFKLQSQSSEDPFFTNAGDQLVEATLMLAKSMCFPDVMIAFSILGSEELIKRLQGNKLNPWIDVAFRQLYSTAGSEKTTASIVATAALTFTRFMKAGVLGAFCGETTLPLDLSGKQLIIFGMDRERRDVVGPLLATVLHMLVTRNVIKPRQDPLIVALDELPTLYLPNLVQWLNENREDGLVSILGFQNLLQLEKAYGKELAGAIFGGCATKFLFNPQNYDSAESFSRYLGEEELFYRSKSKNTGGGKSSITQADQNRTRRLFAADQFLKLAQGNCVLLNPAYGSKSESAVPEKCRLKVAKTELGLQAQSLEYWEPLCQSLAEQSTVRPPNQDDVLARIQEFDLNFPIPKDSEESPTSSSLRTQSVLNLCNQAVDDQLL